MAYNINKTDGTLLVTVADGGINSAATTIRLIGRDLTHYGEILNENLVHMMENFAGGIEPQTPLRGQLWYDTNASELKVYDGSLWTAIGGGSGTITGATNLGGDEGLFVIENAGVLEFRGLTAGAGVELSSDGTSVTISATMGDVDLSTPATVGQVLKWNGSEWYPANDDTGGGGGGSGGAIEAGTVFASAGTMGSPFLLCNGAVVSQATYPVLFTKIGTQYNTGGEGAGNFRLPDMRGRFAVGVGNSGTTGSSALALSDTGGDAAVVLTEAQLASHTHTGGTTNSAGSHTHSYQDQFIASGGGDGLGNFSNGSISGNTKNTNSAGSHSHTISNISNAGSNEAHPNMPPFLTLNWYIASEDVGGDTATKSDLGEFTVAGLPSAAANPNAYALATDASGGRTVVRSDGANWKVIAVEGATVTT